jgi:WD40 repeat protein
VAFDPDGRRIVSGSRDQTVWVWDAQSGGELACLRGHAAAVTSVAFDPDGRRIVSGSWDQTVRVWDAQSGGELACLRGHAAAVTSVAFDPDGRRIVSGSSDQTVRVWDAQSGECLEVIEGSGDIHAIAATGTGLRWRALSREQETVVEPVAGGDPVAWFPAALQHLSSHPSGRAWAGSHVHEVYLIQLEGEPVRQ